jgi:hypothetical protein
VLDGGGSVRRCEVLCSPFEFEGEFVSLDRVFPAAEDEVGGGSSRVSGQWVQYGQALQPMQWRC